MPMTFRLTPVCSSSSANPAIIPACVEPVTVHTTMVSKKTLSFSRMETANGELTAALAAGDAEAAIAADDAFHAVAIEQAANPILAEHLESVTLMLRRAEFLHFDAMSDASVQQHGRIVAALRGGDAEAAVELTRLNWLTIITAGRCLTHSPAGERVLARRW